MADFRDESKIKINLDKPEQVFEINGKDYIVSYDDDKLLKYREVMSKFSKEYERSKVNDADNLSIKEQAKIREHQESLIKELIESVFGEGKYAEIYESSGRSLINILEVVSVFANWMQDKIGKYNKGKTDYYTNRMEKENQEFQRKRKRKKKQVK